MCSVCDLRLPSAQYISHNHYPHYFLSYYPFVVESFLRMYLTFSNPVTSSSITLPVVILCLEWSHKLTFLKRIVVTQYSRVGFPDNKLFLSIHFSKRIVVTQYSRVGFPDYKLFLSIHFSRRIVVTQYSRVGFPDCKLFLSMHNTKPTNIPPPSDSTVNWDSHDKRINPIPREGQSLSKARHLILFCVQPLGGVGTSRKAPVPDRLILFTERRHVGG